MSKDTHTVENSTFSLLWNGWNMPFSGPFFAFLRSFMKEATRAPSISSVIQSHYCGNWGSPCEMWRTRPANQATCNIALELRPECFSINTLARQQLLRLSTGSVLGPHPIECCHFLDCLLRPTLLVESLRHSTAPVLFTMFGHRGRHAVQIHFQFVFRKML